MGQGRGKGGDQAGAIAAGCGAITCMILFMVFGLPMLISGIILIRIGEGDWDDEKRDSIENCLEDDDFWSSIFSRRTTLPPNAYRTHDNDDCTTWDEWEDTKDTLNIVGIVLVVVSVLMVVSGVVLALLMCTSMCKKNGGHVHHVAGAGAVTSSSVVVGSPMVTTSYPQQQPYVIQTGLPPQQIISPPQYQAQPPAYEPTQQPSYQPTAPAAYSQMNYGYQSADDAKKPV